MLIGYNQICINPTKSTYRVGMFSEHNPILNVRGDLYARCLRLKSDLYNVILLEFDSLAVSADIQKIFEEKISDTLNEDVTFIFSCTHTHYAPSLCNISELIKVDKQYLEYTVRKIALMVNNCRLIEKELSINYSWESFDQVGKTRIHNKSNDNVYAGVVSIFDKTTRIGNILFYNCHPTTPQDDANYFSSEYPGSAIENLSKKYPSEFFIFLQGADGDISTRLNRRHTKYEEVTRLGNLMSFEFNRLLKMNQNKEKTVMTLEVKKWHMSIDNKLKDVSKIDFEKLDDYTEKEKIELKHGVKMLSPLIDDFEPFESAVDLLLLTLGDINLFFNPFELFSDYNDLIDKDNTLLVCYSQGIEGYLTQLDNKHISYEWLIEMQTEKDKQNVAEAIKTINS